MLTVQMVQMVLIVQTVPMVLMVLRWRREASWVQGVQFVWREACTGVTRVATVGVLTTGALGIAGVGTHGGRRACMARRFSCVMRACGACVWCVRRAPRSDVRRGRECHCCFAGAGASRQRRALAGRGGGHGAPSGSGHVLDVRVPRLYFSGSQTI